MAPWDGVRLKCMGRAGGKRQVRAGVGGSEEEEVGKGQLGNKGGLLYLTPHTFQYGKKEKAARGGEIGDGKGQVGKGGSPLRRMEVEGGGTLLSPQ